MVLATLVKIVGSTNQPSPSAESFGVPPPMTQLGAFVAGDAGIVEHALALGERGDGPDLGIEARGIADARGLGNRGQAVDHLVMHLALDQQPRARDAGLAGGGENAGDGAVDRVIQLGIGEDDVGRFAAQLQAHMLEAGGGRAIDGGPAGLAAGKGDLGDIGMLGERRTRPGRESR